MHVPKTSGTAMSRSLIDALRPRVIIQKCFDRPHFGAFHEFDTIGADLRKRIYLDQETIPRDAEFVSGHLSYATLSRSFKQAQFVTVLREPISRILSQWLFWRSQTDESLFRWGAWARHVMSSRRPLADFLVHEDIACQIDNVVVRMLVWPHPHIPDRGFIDSRHDETLVHEAILKLERFAFVDAIENPDFPPSLARWLGKSLNYDRENITPSISPEFRSLLHEELTPKAIDLLESHSRLDHRLWTKVITRRAQHLNTEKLQRRILMTIAARYSCLLSSAPEERDRMSARVANLESTIQRQQLCVAQLEADLAAVRSSNSWRVTRPFRVAARLLIGSLKPGEAVRLARKELSEAIHGTYATPTNPAETDLTEPARTVYHALRQVIARKQ